MLFILVSCKPKFPENPIEMIFSLVTPVQRDSDSIKDNAKILSEVAGFLDLSDCTFEYRAVSNVKGNPEGTQATWTRVDDLYWGEGEKYKNELSLYMLRITLYPGLVWNLDFRVKNKSGEVIYTGHWNGSSLSKTDLNVRHIVELGYDNIDSSQIIDTSKTGTINLLVLSQYITSQMLEFANNYPEVRKYNSPTKGKLSLRYRYSGSEGSELNTPKVEKDLSDYKLVLYQHRVYNQDHYEADCSSIFPDIVADYLVKKDKNPSVYTNNLLGLCSSEKFNEIKAFPQDGKSFESDSYDGLAKVTTTSEKYGAEEVEEVLKSGYITLENASYGYYFFYFMYEATPRRDGQGNSIEECNNVYFIWSPVVVLLNEEEVTVVVDLGGTRANENNDSEEALALRKMITARCVGEAAFNKNTKNPDGYSFYDRALVIHPDVDKRISLTDFTDKHGCFLFFDYYNADYIYETPISETTIPSYMYEWIRDGKVIRTLSKFMFCDAYNFKDDFAVGDIIKVTAIKGESVVSGRIILE